MQLGGPNRVCRIFLGEQVWRIGARRSSLSALFLRTKHHFIHFLSLTWLRAESDAPGHAPPNPPEKVGPRASAKQLRARPAAYVRGRRCALRPTLRSASEQTVRNKRTLRTLQSVLIRLLVAWFRFCIKTALQQPCEINCPPQNFEITTDKIFSPVFTPASGKTLQNTSNKAGDKKLGYQCPL